MDNENFYDWVMSHEKVYSLLYSPSRIHNTPISKQLFEMKTKDLNWSLDHDSFTYVWGWPGPDINLYTIKTYGKGWAFSEEEILRAWGELDGSYMDKEQALEAMERIFNYCEEIDLHIPEDERTGYNMLPDVQLVERYILSKEN